MPYARPWYGGSLWLELAEAPHLPGTQQDSRPLLCRAHNMWSATSKSLFAPYAQECSTSPPVWAGSPLPAQYDLTSPCSRHFGHRCKGISMATFKPEEVQALQAVGGNSVRRSALL